MWEKYGHSSHIRHSEPQTSADVKARAGSILEQNKRLLLLTLKHTSESSVFVFLLMFLSCSSHNNRHTSVFLLFSTAFAIFRVFTRDHHKAFDHTQMARESSPSQHAACPVLNERLQLHPSSSYSWKHIDRLDLCLCGVPPFINLYIYLLLKLFTLLLQIYILYIHQRAPSHRSCWLSSHIKTPAGSCVVTGRSTVDSLSEWTEHLHPHGLISAS